MLTYDAYDADRESLHEALCTLGNGYFATRGAGPDTFDDGTPLSGHLPRRRL